jgi:hypothetical protein
MWHLILLLLSSLVGCANHYSEGYFLKGRAGGTGDEFMEPRGQWPEKVWEPPLYIMLNFHVRRIGRIAGTAPKTNY